MQIETGRFYRATVNYHRMDNIKTEFPTPKQGEEVVIYGLWTAEETEQFAGDIAFQVEGYAYWMPQRNFVIHEEIKYDLVKFYETINQTI